MVRASVAIRGDVTWPSVYTYRTSLHLFNRAQYSEDPPLPRNSITAGRLPRSASGWLQPGGLTRRPPRPVQCPAWPRRIAATAVSEPLNRSTFPRAPEEVLLPPVEIVELEQEQTLEAWADAHPHETVASQMVHDDRTISARYCPSCRELRTLRYEIPFIRRYFEQPTWRIWLDVVGLLTAALLLAHLALWGL